MLSEIQAKHQKILQTHNIQEELIYLFHFHSNPEAIRSWVRLPTREGGIITASRHDVYFPSSRRYDLYQLLLPHIKQHPESLGSKNIHFLSKSLFELEQRHITRNWKGWLARIANIYRHAPISSHSTSFGATELSSGVRAVLEHSPRDFLGMLKTHWNEYQHEADLVGNNLRHCKVICVSGQMKEFESTYLLTPKIQSKILASKVSKTDLDFLRLPDDDVLNESTWKHWEFLGKFGVSLEPNLKFYKDVLLQKMLRDMEHDVAKEIYTSMAEVTRGQDHESVRYAIQ